MQKPINIITRLRSVLFFSLMCIYTPVHAALGFLTFPLPLHYRYAFITLWSRFMLFAVDKICHLRYEVIGRENILKENGVILCKHQSAWETLALQVVFPQQTWVIKKELLRIPFFGWALALLSPIAINRGKRKEAMKQLLEQGRQQLAKGRYVVIFPEGTRVAPGKIHKFSKGGATLAFDTNVPIFPVAHNAGSFWPKRGFIKYPGTIKMIIGKPIYPQSRSVIDLTKEVQDYINTQVAQLEQGK